jgi:hypothetical protein
MLTIAYFEEAWTTNDSIIVCNSVFATSSTNSTLLDYAS